ncbi:hypothetical protein Cni_G17590 [Canna indica]|uniref:CCHC-type domain-containing protein n=1 Tax=Canna indica TaxID=4628 RepID=A0AAQ3KMN6_9LILI|nr:hypothetical protein Cni_G17590 [Canna indica]
MLDEKFKKIQSAFENEVCIENDLLVSARADWCNSLYGKFYGITPLPVIQQALPKIWKLRCNVQAVDLAVGYFYFKFAYEEDRNKVFTEGPWFFRGHALLLTPWNANFQPLMKTIDVIPVWIQLPDLPLEYLQKDILMKIVRSIGQPIKIDGVTMRGLRAKFARVCILWSLKNKVPPGIWINGDGLKFWQAIAFESIPKLCFACGKMGHLVDHCSEKVDLNFDSSSKAPQDVMAFGSKIDDNKVAEQKRCDDMFGPWQVINRKKKPQSRKFESQEGSNKNRYEALNEVKADGHTS